MQITQKLKEAKEEGIQIRADCQAMIKQYQVKLFIFDCYVSPGPFDLMLLSLQHVMDFLTDLNNIPFKIILRAVVVKSHLFPSSAQCCTVGGVLWVTRMQHWIHVL